MPSHAISYLERLFLFHEGTIMKLFKFSKMHGAGNDFIVVDNTTAHLRFSAESVVKLCDRRRGVGADGLILLSKSCVPGCDNITMEFFNCDGSKAELCGNGLRCAAMFAFQHSMTRNPTPLFITGGGELHARVLSDNTVRIELPLTEPFERLDGVEEHTVYHGVVGVPHLVLRMDDLRNCDILPLGRRLRNSKAFQPEGTNVNFISFDSAFKNPVEIRTFERGVEDETMACGTGIAAAGCVLWKFFHAPARLTFRTRCGDLLQLDVNEVNGAVSNMKLTGPAVEILRGTACMDLFGIEIGN